VNTFYIKLALACMINISLPFFFLHTVHRVNAAYKKLEGTCIFFSLYASFLISDFPFLYASFLIFEFT
jgi:hypothetical protein